MVHVYSVRCNFTRDDLSAEWNAWYNGPKLAQMLSKPMFLSGQRFKAVGLDQTRQYLALWVVESTQAFETKAYKSDWGFAYWASYITDWSRDLFEAPTDAELVSFRVGQDEFLYLASFEYLSEEEAEAELERIRTRRPSVMWMRSVGLDRHSPLLGLQRVDRQEPELQCLDTSSRVKETVFRPISRFASASAS